MQILIIVILVSMYLKHCYMYLLLLTYLPQKENKSVNVRWASHKEENQQKKIRR